MTFRIQVWQLAVGIVVLIAGAAGGVVFGPPATFPALMLVLLGGTMIWLTQRRRHRVGAEPEVFTTQAERNGANGSSTATLPPARPPRSETRERIFTQSAETVFEVLRRTVAELGYAVLRADPRLRTLFFKTGEMTLISTVGATADGGTRVVISGRAERAGASGDSARVADGVLAALGRHLGLAGGSRLRTAGVDS